MQNKEKERERMAQILFFLYLAAPVIIFIAI